MTTPETDQSANCCPEGKNARSAFLNSVFLKDHSQHPPLEIIVAMSNIDELDWRMVEHAYRFEMGEIKDVQFVEVRQENKPVHQNEYKIRPNIPVDVRILRNWKDAVSFLLTNPKSDAFAFGWLKRRSGEADLQFHDKEQLTKFNQLQHFPFVRCLELKDYELGQMDESSPDYTKINLLLERVPFMKEFIFATPSQKDWEFLERNSFVDIFRGFASVFPDPLLAVVFDYAQSELNQTVQECLTLGKRGVRILVGDEYWLLRQTNLFYECANCKQMETDLLRFKLCGQCKRRKYCSLECQKKHWKKQHKIECQQLLGALAVHWLSVKSLFLQTKMGL